MPRAFSKAAPCRCATALIPFYSFAPPEYPSVRERDSQPLHALLRQQVPVFLQAALEPLPLLLGLIRDEVLLAPQRDLVAPGPCGKQLGGAAKQPCRSHIKMWPQVQYIIWKITSIAYSCCSACTCTQITSHFLQDLVYFYFLCRKKSLGFWKWSKEKDVLYEQTFTLEWTKTCKYS